MAKKEVEETKKMTLKEYESNYSKRENTRLAKTISTLIIAGIGVVVGSCLALLVLKVFDINKYAGYVSIVAAIFVFIFAFIVPVVKIKKTKYFETNVNIANAREAKRHNKEVREDIADKMIDFSTKTDGVGWYQSDLIGKLAVARHTKDDEGLKAALTEIFDKDVRKTANSIIREHALRIGMSTALSQSDKLDTLFVAVYELNLIKDLVFLYGYRPNDAKMMKIYSTVLNSALVAYGVQGVTNSLGTSVASKIGDAAKGIPFLGNAISTVVSSASQGIVNASMTIVLGKQTMRYLKNEYHLQDLLDNIELDDDEQNLINEVKAEIIEKTKNIKVTKKPVEE